MHITCWSNFVNLWMWARHPIDSLLLTYLEECNKADSNSGCSFFIFFSLTICIFFLSKNTKTFRFSYLEECDGKKHPPAYGLFLNQSIDDQTPYRTLKNATEATMPMATPPEILSSESAKHRSTFSPNWSSASGAIAYGLMRGYGGLR